MKGEISIPMEMYFKVDGKMEAQKAKCFISTKLEQNMKVNGQRVKK